MRPILERVFKRSTKENVIDLISQKNEGWAPSKKRPKKAELKEDFLALAAIINPDEIEDFIEMAVMSKNVGLPAYTYKINSLDFLEVRENEEENPIRDIQQIKDQPYGDQYLVSAEEVEDSVAELNIIFRLKEYAEVWKNGGIRNRDTLSAVYKIKVILDKQRQIVTIFTGNHYVQEVISSFLSSVQKWPLQNYRIREIANQSYQIGNASFKTALLLDLVSNRFQERGIFSNFKEIKFNTKNSKHTSQGIRSITINGRNLLTSYLACEYITLGSDILSFKIDMTFEDINFSTLFFLKGNDFDILKIVVVGQESNEFKERVIDIIQEEYIAMCNHGMYSITETKTLLSQIYEKFINGDKFSNEVVENATLSIIESLVQMLGNLNKEDENTVDLLEIIYKENKSILDTVGYDGENEGLQKLKEFIAVEEESEFESYDPLETEELE